MADSLKDQLLKAGLRPAKPVKARKKQPRADKEIDLAKAYQLRKSATDRQKQQSREQKLADDRRRREINKKLREIVATHSVRDPEAALARNFVYKGRIRKVMVNREQLLAVNSGDLVIVYVAGSYHLLPAEKTVEIREFAADHIPDLEAETDPSEDEHPVPDDLTW
jgi:uncharacterized protein YaiL (DUF2058 family)